MKNKYIKKSLPLVAGIFTFAALASVVGSVIVSQTHKTSLSSEAPTHINTPYADLISYEEQLNALQEEMDELKTDISLLEKLDTLHTTINAAIVEMDDASSEKTLATTAINDANNAIISATTAKRAVDATVDQASTVLSNNETIIRDANELLKNVTIEDIDQTPQLITFYENQIVVPNGLPVVNNTTLPASHSSNGMKLLDSPRLYSSTVAVETPVTYARPIRPTYDDSKEVDPTLTGYIREYNNFIDRKNSYLEGLVEAKTTINLNLRLMAEARRDRSNIQLHGVFFGGSKNWTALAGSHVKSTVLAYIDAQIDQYHRGIELRNMVYHLDITSFDVQTQQTIAERDDVNNQLLRKINDHCKEKINYYKKIRKSWNDRDASKSLLPKLQANLANAQDNQILANAALTSANKQLKTADDDWQAADKKWKAANASLTSAQTTWNLLYPAWVNSNGELDDNNPSSKLTELRNELKTIQIEKYNPLYELYSSLYAQLGAN